jgi:hypothetical protein
MNKKQSKFTCLVVPAAATSGIISGIFSVITVYFFKPIWEKTMKWWNNERKIS